MIPIDRRYRLVYKPVVWLLCLAPALLLAARGIGWASPSLGADPAREILEVLGKTALNILLLTLAVTPLRHLTGNSHLLRLRRLLGLFAFAYAALHLTTYVVLDLQFDFGALWADILKRPYITIGMLAILLLLPLAVTSTRGMMRRLGRRWQALHRLVYLIAILGVWHYYWQVKADVREPLIYSGVLAALLGWRLLRNYRTRQVAHSRNGAGVGPITSTSAPATTPGRT
jgi:methionine sulfoxide reductase heme-binding subunit